MKFITRAAVLAAVTFCAGAFAHAATIEVSNLPEDAALQTNNPQEHHLVPVLAEVSRTEIVQPLPAEDETPAYATLSAAVADQDHPGDADRELHCLAVGVYYESKGEPLAGQLAVAEVILNRAASGRFARSVCGVITQRGQFSFVRGGVLPTPPNDAAWRRAMAVAQVAQKDLWDSPVGGALYFHARYVSPGWRRPRVGTVGNHVFYR